MRLFMPVFVLGSAHPASKGKRDLGEDMFDEGRDQVLGVLDAVLLVEQACALPVAEAKRVHGLGTRPRLLRKAEQIRRVVLAEGHLGS